MSQSTSLRSLLPVPPPSAKKTDAYQEIEKQVERDLGEFDQGQAVAQRSGRGGRAIVRD